MPARGAISVAGRSSPPAGALAWSARLLVATSWISGAIFAAYILAFFGGTAAAGLAERWNGSLPGLFDRRNLIASIAIGLHFLAGGILLLLGPVQLIGAVRRRAPALHRQLGRAYVVAAALAGVGGLAFIFGRGTIGGPIMDVGFGVYGALMLLCAIMAFNTARHRQYEQHRAWAIRLFALTIGSWLYRMEYAFWFLAAGGIGHNRGLNGWFDAVMVFFFYIPNLAVAELFIRALRRRRDPRFDAGIAVMATAASVFIIAATWSFTARRWLPGIVEGAAAFAAA
ncbi:DUF2306 domain-containing protein [Sphingomonas sp.]|uniref:DUF2306 domain-containing protein n=1 Tax=Sphingomonas sp. TaxID=28214 RepID=UPI002CD2CECF|nr:DUF2306 domain-containing protein [Sphingomonas sp.]HTG37652.1 DUF2306 domain-containing protein [Sphingomonas sp.]